jgi:hypothetical protein
MLDRDTAISVYCIRKQYKENKMSYLSNNFDAFQEGIINGGYDPQEQDNHPVQGGDDWMFGWGAEPYEDSPYDGTYSEE